MNFRVGMKVVLVNDSGWSHVSHHNYPKKGIVYTIRDLFRDLDGDLCLRVNEITNGRGLSTKTFERCEPCWLAVRFRPAVSPKSQISFTQGDPLDSEQWDNRRRLPARVKEIGASA